MYKKAVRFLSLLCSIVVVTSSISTINTISAKSHKETYSNWSDYGGSADSMQYSAIKQINKSNVGQLKLAWFMPAPGPVGRFSFNPLVVDGVMYVVGKDMGIYALDGETGKQIWVHEVKGGQPTNRGFNWWSSKDGRDRRLIFAVDGYMQELDLKTGLPIESFGDHGKVNLREGLGRDPASIGEIQNGTPGRVFDNLIILGSAPGEMYGSPPGDLRAYDVLTGNIVWTFHTVPHPGEFGYDTMPPDAWKYVGGNNTWGEISIDEERGIAYFPLGSPTYDLYGADRKGADLFGDCLLALDARTGKRLWHFQLVHHDLWDYDPTAAPKLLTVRHDGTMTDVVALAGKTGFLYVFDRVTGKPLWPIEERAVPKSDMPDEESWPTQPFPTAPQPFARQQFTVKDINPYLDSIEKERIHDLVTNARNEGIFTPVTDKGNQISVPGEFGGVNQGSTAADPSTGMMYVKAYDLPTIHAMTKTPPIKAKSVTGGTPEQRGYGLYTKNCIGCHGPNRERITFPKQIDVNRFTTVLRSGNGEMPAFSETTLKPEDVTFLAAYLTDPVAGEAAAVASVRKASAPAGPAPEGQTRYYGPFGNIFRTNNGLPAFSPPWSSIVAYDLNDGSIKWRRPIGTTPGLAEKGITDTGSSLAIRNGPVVTAGGLIIIGTGPDRMVHALDKDTGRTLWETELDANPDGIPAIYEAGGNEYIAFYASVDGKPQSVSYKPGKAGTQGYYVFSLSRAPSTSH
ncbi:PQQ-binding-like beta-propeller repeat protein [Edaphobacter modestus]|uniref:Quinoprotein glucose dehydrogenase n=1 Tax=Edaphobacter modestus TaxID=388466 RepID=A0A4Q7XZV8_9BACT|nr:PQQ-binding-like beta-propeller repeat protein [Edaphobacter modestus]RZU29718.1 quinoprotein glucose dehydrogenase [Edaphobacter modestus]